MHSVLVSKIAWPVATVGPRFARLEMRFVHCFSLLLIDVLHASYSLGVDNECN
jgi:hypothetical protein